ncbi:MAG: dihydropteroate synthase [Kiloniellales bacterium]|nr:dihydropteroate synthase [Kiloniellales bacterium]
MGSIYLRPLGLDAAASAAEGLPLAGGPLRFAAAEVAWRSAPGPAERESLPLGEALARVAAEAGDEAGASLRDRLSRARSAFAGLALDRTRIMGVINVTPDSFSDGGDRFDPGRAVADGQAMLAAGADILDVGGESTRPGAAPVEPAEEQGRVLPVIRALAAEGAVVSIDSRNAATMAEALTAGAAIVNDVSALTGDPRSLSLVAEAGCGVVLMHMQGAPQTMQQAPRYDDVVLDVYDFLQARLEACLEAGIPRAAVAVDPGIGFGKSLAHNLALLESLAIFHGLGCPILLGVSRKSFIARLAGEAPPKARLPGSLAAALSGLARGVQILRVHDVAETVQAVRVWEAIRAAPPATESPKT